MFPHSPWHLNKLELLNLLFCVERNQPFHISDLQLNWLPSFHMVADEVMDLVKSSTSGLISKVCF